jgi:hypothetical protein
LTCKTIFGIVLDMTAMADFDSAESYRVRRLDTANLRKIILRRFLHD